MEDHMTGYLKGSFMKEFEDKRRVINFYIKSDGYKTAEGSFESLEYPFETWLPVLIDKIKEIPRESLVTVRFTIVPKKRHIEGFGTINYVVLKANSITYWNKQQKGGAENDANDKGEQIEFGFANGEHFLFDSGSEGS